MLTVDTYTGRLLSISGTYTTLEIVSAVGERSTISLPNSLFLKRAIAGHEPPPAVPTDQAKSNNTPQP